MAIPTIDMREYIQPPPPSAAPPPPPAVPPHRRTHPFAHWSAFVNTTLLLLVLLYGGALLLSRTAGFADIVRGQLDKRLGLAFTVGHAALTPSLGLVLQDVKAAVPKHPLQAGVAAKRVVIRWNWLNVLLGGDSPLRALRVEEADLHFAVDAAGRWQPAPFNQVSEWLARRLQLDLNRYTSMVTRAAAPGGAAPANELDLFGEQHVELVDALVHWQVVADSEIARAEGVDLSSTRIALSNREITHFLLHMRTAATAQGVKLEGRRMELMQLDDRELWLEGTPVVVTNAMPRRMPPVRAATPVLAEPPRPTVATNAVPEKASAAPPVLRRLDEIPSPGPEE